MVANVSTIQRNSPSTSVRRSLAKIVRSGGELPELTDNNCCIKYNFGCNWTNAFAMCSNKAKKHKKTHFCLVCEDRDDPHPFFICFIVRAGLKPTNLTPNWRSKSYNEDLDKKILVPYAQYKVKCLFIFTYLYFIF